ncbi:hypothetical protein NN561_016843 [Cricetulus griseus]
MARLWKALVLVVALAVVPCEAHRPPRFEDIVDRAIEAYNNGRPGKPLFRLVDATQPSGQVLEVQMANVPQKRHDEKLFKDSRWFPIGFPWQTGHKHGCRQAGEEERWLEGLLHRGTHSQHCGEWELGQALAGARWA